MATGTVNAEHACTSKLTFTRLSWLTWREGWTRITLVRERIIKADRDRAQVTRWIAQYENGERVFAGIYLHARALATRWRRGFKIAMRDEFSHSSEMDPRSRDRPPIYEPIKRVVESSLRLGDVRATEPRVRLS